MELFIDVGNSRIKWRWWMDDSFLGRGDARHFGKVSDELVTQLAERSIDRIRVACVARAEFGDDLRIRLDRHISAPLDWLTTPAEGLGLINSYAQPSALGVDRWLAMAAAFAESGGGVCVIDVGTAITVDVVGDGGVHFGGLIAPGLGILNRALASGTALPDSQAELPPPLGLAQSTEAAIRTGVLLQVCALIDRGIAISRERVPGCALYITGGDADTVLPHLSFEPKHDPDLIFRGIAMRAREDRG